MQRLENVPRYFLRLPKEMFSLSRSELLSTFFPSWRYLGRRLWKPDPHFWGNYVAHPVLSSFYPPHFLSAIASRFLSLNVSFCFFCYIVVGHITFGLLGWFFLLSTRTSIPAAIFGALTLAFGSYNLKQQPCLVYTVAWFPWLLYGIGTNNQLLAGVACGAVLLAGYYPIGIQVLLVAGCATVVWGRPLSWIPIGFILGLPQLVPFLKYLPKTIRRVNGTNREPSAIGVGTMKPADFLSILFPLFFRSKMNGVGFWESSFYIGITPLLLAFYSTSGVWTLAIFAIALCLGMFAKHLPRIPARWLFTLQFALGWMAVSGLHNLNLAPPAIWGLILLQIGDLWLHNRHAMVPRPFSELPRRPSWAFNTKLTAYLDGCKTRVSGLPYPLFTGHVNGLFTLGYSGGMQNKLMAKWRGDADPNGSGDHDWFKKNEDGESLDRYRVGYAYTRKRIDWEATPVAHLYRNPRI